MLDPCQQFPGVMDRLEKVSALKADGIRWFRCPAHKDDSPSGWCFIHPQSRMLVLKCFKGCQQIVIMRSVGISRKDIHMSSTNSLKWIKFAHYDYRHADSTVAFRVVRLHGMDGQERVAKKFIQQKPIGGGKWEDNIDGVIRPLYRLPELLKCEVDDTVFFVEGEGKCDKVRSLGIPAVTLNGGAQASLDEYQACPLHGRRIVLSLDNDEYGQRWAERISYSLMTQARRPRSLSIMTFSELQKGDDVADWIDARRKSGSDDGQIRFDLLRRSNWLREIIL